MNTAFEKARAAYGTGAYDDATLEFLFPELKDSEDERIRKTLIHIVKGACDKYGIKYKGDDITKEKLLSYLEKQKEQIPYTDFVIKPHKGDDNNPYDMRVSEAQEYAIKRGFGIPFNDGEVYVDERHLTQTIGNILRWADDHPKEQKPAEWSEEDENALEYLHELICFGVTEKFFDGQTAADMRIWVNTRLKSVRPRPQWKPSEEQMKHLKDRRGCKAYKRG